MAHLYSTLFVTFFVLTTLLISPVFAADKDEVVKLKAENQKKVEQGIEKETPITEWISSEKALLKKLPEKNRQTFFILRNKHSVIRSVEVVKRDVGNAVKACAENNKDMAKAMKTRFSQWTGVVDPILKDAQKFLELELKEQEAFHVSDYRHVTELNDKAYNFSESQIQKSPVTTKEACQGLLDSMDRTEESLINILQDILLPEEVVRKRLEQAKEAKEKAKK